MKKLLPIFVLLLSFTINSFGQIGVNQPTDIELCDGDGDGFEAFDLSIKIPEILSGLDPVNYSVSFHNSLQDADIGSNPLAIPYTNTSNPETIFVRVFELSTGNYEVTSFDLVVGVIPELGLTLDLITCEYNYAFDLTVTENDILNGLDPNQFSISYFTNANNALLNINAIQNPNSFTLYNNEEATIYVRVENIDNGCFDIEEFDLKKYTFCNFDYQCSDEPEDIQWSVGGNNNPSEYIIENLDGMPLHISFTDGNVEFGCEELIVLDSDDETNLNANTPFGNNGDLTGLSFTTTGSRLTVIIAPNGNTGCAPATEPIDFNVICVPSCNAGLLTPFDGSDNVSVTTDLSWFEYDDSAESYRLSIGLTPGGTEILDNEDIGDITTYDPGVLEYETTYYINIIPFNSEGDLESCGEQSFTTSSNLNTLVLCEEGAVNTTYCYTDNDDAQFSFQSSDGQPLTIVFNSGSTETIFDEVYIEDSDGTVLNPDLLYGNDGDFTGLTYTSSGDILTLRFDSDGIISCASGSGCCTTEFDFDVFCASTVGFIQVNAFVDTNTNGINDMDELGFYNGFFTYEINGDGIINTVNSSTGSFQIISGNETDVYDISFNLYDESDACYDITTANFNDISVATGSTITVDFPVIEEQSCEDLAVYLINDWAPPRPGFNYTNYLYLENLGFTTISSGTVEFVMDSQLVFDSTFGVNPNYIITNTSSGFTVDFVNLQPGESESIGISMTCPVSLALGELITNSATYITEANDLVPGNNNSTIREVVVGSWDPNDIFESHGPEIVYDDFIVSDEWLYYTIRFQNLGTAEAIFIRIEDELDAQLDETTFQMLRSSHDYMVTRTGSSLEWFFDDINLPAEQDDAEGSNGYVHFRIKPQPGYAVGDIIPNSAAIYFDFNAPVITNTFNTTFVEPLSIEDERVIRFSMYPNPAKDKVTIELNNSLPNDLEISLIDIQGKRINVPLSTFESSIELNVSSLNVGLYFIEFKKGNSIVVEKLIIE